MKFNTKNAAIVLLAAFYFTGCAEIANTNVPSLQEGNMSNVKENSVFVRNENLATAVYLLIKKVNEIEKSLAFASREIGNISQTHTTTAAEVSTIKNQVKDITSELEVYRLDLSELKKKKTEVSQDRNVTTEANITLTKPPVISATQKKLLDKNTVVEVIKKKTAIYEKASNQSRKIRNVRASFRLESLAL